MSTPNLSGSLELMDCPLCLGKGRLSRTEVLERLGMRDLTRVAELSAKEALGLLEERLSSDETKRWTRFESEIQNRVNQIEQKHRDQVIALEADRESLRLELKQFQENQGLIVRNEKEAQRLVDASDAQQKYIEMQGRISELEAQAKVWEDGKAADIKGVKTELEAKISSATIEIGALNRNYQDSLREISSLREKNQSQESELEKLRRAGKKEEVEFQQEVRTWPGIWIGDKLTRHGDYILAFRDLAGNAADPQMLVDNKDKEAVTDEDVDKLVRDLGERKMLIGILLAHDESQLRQADKERRWSSRDGVWLLRTTRAWLPRDLDILKPLVDRIRFEGPEFLAKNIHLAQEVRRTLEDLDKIDEDLKKAERNIESAREKLSTYCSRIQTLCAAPLEQATTQA